MMLGFFYKAISGGGGKGLSAKYNVLLYLDLTDQNASLRACT
jgi:hypothetical protein